MHLLNTKSSEKQSRCHQLTKADTKHVMGRHTGNREEIPMCQPVYTKTMTSKMTIKGMKKPLFLVKQIYKIWNWSEDNQDLGISFSNMGIYDTSITQWKKYTEYYVFVNLCLSSELEKGLRDEALLSLANLSEASWSSLRLTKTYI